MTYEQALNKKKSMDPSFIDGGITLDVFITPENPDDFHRYIDDIRRYFNNLSDEDAKQYSTNGQFSIMGLSYNGTSIQFKPLV